MAGDELPGAHDFNSVEDCKGFFRAPEDRRVLPTRSRPLGRQFERACELAKTYTKSPPYLTMEAKRGDTFGQVAIHCNKWAGLQAKEAQEAEALATLHEDMAKAAEQKQKLIKCKGRLLAFTRWEGDLH